MVPGESGKNPLWLVCIRGHVLRAIRASLLGDLSIGRTICAFPAIGDLKPSNFPFVARWEQFEVWRLAGTRWELVASFPDFDLANEVARKRGSQVRLIHTVYDDSKMVEQEVLMELGAPRQQP